MARYRFILALLTMLLVPLVFLAQGVTDLPPDPPESAKGWLQLFGSTVGVGMLTGIAAWRLKKDAAGIPVISALPLWLYVIATGVGLTYLAHSLMGTLEGDNLWRLAVEGIVIALATIGVREVKESGVGKPLAQSGTGDGRL